MTGAHRPPSIIRDFIEQRGFLFYYGEPSTGKTVLARLLYETLREWDFRVCYIAAEPGSVAVSERIQAVNLYGVAEGVFKCISRRVAPIIDTVNSFYTGTLEDGRILAFISAISRSARLPVVAAGQVRGESVPWGGLWITPWATHVARVRRLHRGVSILEFEKPRRAVAAFKVSPLSRGDYGWI